MDATELAQGDLNVLAHYGRTMASVQEFEFAMVRLARLVLPDLPEDVPFEPAWRKLQRQFKKADGPLVKRLLEAGHSPREVLEDIMYLLTGRKSLAHEFLLSYMLEQTAGAANRAQRISILEEAEGDFLQWRDFVDALQRSVADERGVTPEAADFSLDEVRETFERQDTQRLLSDYGKAMHAVQLWELSLKGLLVFFDLPGDDEDITFDEAWAPVERTLTTAAGPLKQRLGEQGYGPQDLHDELDTFRNRRNELAHTFFVDYVRIKANQGARSSYDNALRFLEAMLVLFSEQKARLDGLSDEQAGERGWDLDDLGGLTEEELWRIAMQEEEPEQE